MPFTMTVAWAAGARWAPRSAAIGMEVLPQPVIMAMFRVAKATINKRLNIWAISWRGGDDNLKATLSLC